MNLDNKELMIRMIEEICKRIIGEYDGRWVPIGISNRHIHLSKEDLELLFGEGYQLTKLKDLGQPGQYAAKETVKILGPKGSFEAVRILGPVRDMTQVEVSLTDGFILGIKAPIRESGKIDNTPNILIEGPNGRVEKNGGAIAALRHIHMPPQIAEEYRLKDKEMVSVQTQGIRKTIYENVLVRVSDGYELEMHIDTDEANASGLKNGDRVKIINNKE